MSICKEFVTTEDDHFEGEITLLTYFLWYHPECITNSNGGHYFQKLINSRVVYSFVKSMYYATKKMFGWLFVSQILKSFL